MHKYPKPKKKPRPTEEERAKSRARAAARRKMTKGERILDERVATRLRHALIGVNSPLMTPFASRLSWCLTAPSRKHTQLP